MCKSCRLQLAMLGARLESWTAYRRQEQAERHVPVGPGLTRRKSTRGGRVPTLWLMWVVGCAGDLPGAEAHRF
jgi:hypothetical protein